MGAHKKPASQLTGHDNSKAKIELMKRKEREAAGANDRLKQGLEGLKEVEMKRLINIGAKELYDSLAKEASKSSVLSNNHIHDLIDMANEYEKLKEYNRLIKKYKAVVFENGKFQANPAEKMRKDSLKEIDAIKSRLGMKAVDIVNLARENDENNEINNLKALFTDDEEE
ncbi:cupin superfamily acireductone dioxygenase involved in methionine salvage [Neobacillus niacini]|uniref:P27 family phage terminase small subunit n=1 Tax=Neobacillus niacini TaxID=86668 RepID=UPI0027811C4C|nr:P27 family phage terminase small subunit [Neobacillus niacini]MDQ0999775.1 cupin superfamily acireductone dioxygenase involved in methionine salvage [Neobacillus niacini]